MKLTANDLMLISVNDDLDRRTVHDADDKSYTRLVHDLSMVLATNKDMASVVDDSIRQREKLSIEVNFQGELFTATGIVSDTHIEGAYRVFTLDVDGAIVRTKL